MPSRIFKKKGFTLIDLLIVCMILGVLAMIAAPQFHTMNSESKLNSAASEVVSAIHFARNLSLTYQRVFYFRAKTPDNVIQVGDLKYKNDPNPHLNDDPPVLNNGLVLNPLTKLKYDLDFDTLSDLEGVNITSAPAGEYIYFYPDGHSSEADSTIVLSYSNQQRTITVDGYTGKTTLN
jgi:prepilin-type N-terminal cleavage/methylation domain-containing protein